ncbi:diguanylate cyclase [Curvibacter sp. CHRR-16]|nr:diguanylate cyclase [Curvibacter sp. CHRR-16]
MTLQQSTCHRILIVDDTPANIQVVASALHEDYEVLIASSARKALELLKREHKPDLILLDVMMPDMDGYTLCGQLKQDPELADIPVIFITALSGSADETKGLSVGGSDFISKPINVAVLRARVKTHLALKQHADLLRSMVYVDGLTGVANRRRFDEALQTAYRNCVRHAKDLSLLMIDVDYFKRYNDYYGHQAGDQCLQKIATALSSVLHRGYDLVARYGGEEFVCLVPECDFTSAQRMAEALRAAVLALDIAHADSPIAPRVTVSVGVSTGRADRCHSPHVLLEKADAALYEAKRQGRDRVVATAL